MKIGVAGLMSLDLLNIDYKGRPVPEGYSSPLVANLINGIIKRGYKVVAYTTSSDISEPLVFEDENITLCVARRSEHPGRNFFKTERQDLLDLMKKYPADVISAQWSYEFAWAAIDSGIPTVVTMRDNATKVLKYLTDPFRAVRWMINFIVLRKSRHLTTNSNYLYSQLSNRDKSKAVVINNFFKKGLENNFDLEPKENYIVTVSNGYGKIKNVDTGLKAFALIREKYPDLEYHLVGHEMEEGGKTYRYAVKNNLEKGVKFIGNLPYKQVMDKIQKAKVLMHPSREETFGNVVLEAMILGTPVVGGKNSGNVSFLLGDGQYGLLCDINSNLEIANCANKLLEDNDYWQNIRTKAFKYATTNFSEDYIVDSYIDAFHKVFEKSTVVKKESMFMRAAL